MSDSHSKSLPQVWQDHHTGHTMLREHIGLGHYLVTDVDEQVSDLIAKLRYYGKYRWPGHLLGAKLRLRFLSRVTGNPPEDELDRLLAEPLAVLKSPPRRPRKAPSAAQRAAHRKRTHPRRCKARDKPPVALRGAKAKDPYLPCACGCGKMSKALFSTGHESRVRWWCQWVDEALHTIEGVPERAMGYYLARMLDRTLDIRVWYAQYRSTTPPAPPQYLGRILGDPRSPCSKAVGVPGDHRGPGDSESLVFNSLKGGPPGDPQSPCFITENKKCSGDSQGGRGPWGPGDLK